MLLYLLCFLLDFFLRIRCSITDPYAGWCPGLTFEIVYTHLMLSIAKCFYSSAEKKNNQ